jgi:hypothetical protein
VLRSSAGPVTFHIQQTVAPTAAGSLVRIVMEGEARGMLGMAARVAVKAADKQLRTDLKSLKALLEH